MYPHHANRFLPIPPQELLKRFFVDEPSDTRFRACARLLQSIWRERRGLSRGSYVRRDEDRSLALGSRLDTPEAMAGFNYLTPDIARLVRREIAYRERGALIDEVRAWENLLSSTALTFNLLAPLKAEPQLAAAVLNEVMQIDAERVDGVWFETSPGRGDDAFIGDSTALDALIAYTSKNGKAGFVGIEIKYAEGAPTNSTPVKPRLPELAKRSALFVDPTSDTLQRPPLRQFFAEHVLCYSMVDEQRLFDEGHFVVVAPAQNDEVASAIAGYRNHLTAESEDILPFAAISLEAMVTALGELGDPDLARALSERYLDFGPIHDAIEDWTPFAVR